jgi:Fur family zinc uptake transcriptional regulator
MIDKARLIAKCKEAGKSITVQRLDIIEELSNLDSSVSAYDLLEYLNNKGHSFNISTIYRVLDFWIDIGVVHKVESNNTYLICNDSHLDHFHVLLHCDNCQSVEESCEISNKVSIANNQKFTPKKGQVIELHGLCNNCKS